MGEVGSRGLEPLATSDGFTVSFTFLDLAYPGNVSLMPRAQSCHR